MYNSLLINTHFLHLAIIFNS